VQQDDTIEILRPDGTTIQTALTAMQPPKDGSVSWLLGTLQDRADAPQGSRCYLIVK
jgi:hypothetical protein